MYFRVLYNVLRSVVLCMVVAQQIFGTRFQYGLVVSGSMEPAMHHGSFIVTEHREQMPIGVGDVITFVGGAGTRYKKMSIAHRVVRRHVRDGAECFVTRGDANPSDDAAMGIHGLGVPCAGRDRIEGKVVLHVPYAGWPFLIVRALVAKARHLCVELAHWMAYDGGAWVKIG